MGRRTRPRPLGKGLTYLTNQKDALERFLEDGRLPLDNVRVGREMRPIVLGRKNWLFAGNFAAAERLADGLTVVATPRVHGVDPVDMPVACARFPGGGTSVSTQTVPPRVLSPTNRSVRPSPSASPPP